MIRRIVFASLVAGLTGLFLSTIPAGEPKPKEKPAALPTVADVFPMAVDLEKDPTPEKWQDLFDRILEVQREIETSGKRLPYSDRKKMVKVNEHRILPLAKPGLHSLWTGNRHVSKAAPGPGGSYINTAVAIMPNSLTNEANKN